MLSSGKSKKELLAISRFSTSMGTKEDARRILIENELLPLGQDPDLSEMNCKRQRPNSGSPPLSMLSYRRSWSLTVP